LGKKFAICEGVIILVLIAKHFSIVASPKQKDPPKGVCDLTYGPKRGVHVIVQKRK